jgi:REP element-mobilizing transposase RayT
MSPTQNRDRQGAVASAYLITFVCYGTWLHGRNGAVDRNHNQFGGRYAEADAARESRSRDRMRQDVYSLDSRRRSIVLNALQECCRDHHWVLLAVHVRTNHVHVVVSADRSVEHVMGSLKAFASIRLNDAGIEPPDRRRWARHGSTRHLWSSVVISAAVHYVVCEQGDPMAVWEQCN